MRQGKRFFSRFGWLCMWLMLAGPLAAATINVLPDRDPAVIGEEFTLTFSSDEQPSGNPDFSPLYQDFEVTSTSTSQNIQMINGVASRQFSWRLQLYPKLSGELTIPAIRFGRDQSPVTRIRVVDEAPDGSGGRDDVLVELELETPQPYVQQQIIIRQRLLHSVALRRTGATMTHPVITDGKGMIEQLGQVVN
ncbi:MAG: BatD family protein, partial [Thiolinea sp.]